MDTNRNPPDFVVVGAGFFGATVARLLAERNFSVQVFDLRSHIGGNAYSYKDSKSGIEVHSYGTHIFHTNRLDIWDFVNSFEKFFEYKHTVIGRRGNEYVNLPVNLSTLSTIYDLPLTPYEAKEILGLNKIIPTGLRDFRNFEEFAISAVGKRVYEYVYRDYTKKQWGINPSELPSEIFKRLPIRFNFNMDYFEDAYQGLPVNGYGALFNNMLDSRRIDVTLETKWNRISNLSGKFGTIYSGPIDQYFNYEFGELGWRVSDFEFQWLSDLDDYQGTSVVNYLDAENPFTRIHEFKHLSPTNAESTFGTIIAKETSRDAVAEEIPYYPIRTSSNLYKLKKYRQLMLAEKNVWFGGRLGSYLYLDMHMAIASAFKTVDNIIEY